MISSASASLSLTWVVQTYASVAIVFECRKIAEICSRLFQSKSALEANRLFQKGNFFASFIAHFGNPIPLTTPIAAFLIAFLTFFFADGELPSPLPLGTKYPPRRSNSLMRTVYTGTRSMAVVADDQKRRARLFLHNLSDIRIHGDIHIPYHMLILVWAGIFRVAGIGNAARSRAGYHLSWKSRRTAHRHLLFQSPTVLGVSPRSPWQKIHLAISIDLAPK